IPWLSVVDFNTGKKYVEKTEKAITKAGLENSSTTVLHTGDIIISARGTVGAIAVLKKPMAFNQSCYGIRAKQECTHNDYLYYLIKHSLNQFKRKTHGAVFDTITRETFNYIDICLPQSLEEQSSISYILSSLDSKIDLLRRQNQTLENIAQTLFKRWFVDFKFPDNSGKPYKSSGGKMVESELGEIPEGWKVDILENVANISIGRTPPRKENEWFSTNSSDVKWISIKDLGNSGIYIDSTAEYLTEDAVQRFNIPIIPKNTVILSFKLTVGRVAITTERMLSNEAIAHININSSRTSAEHMFLLLKLFNYQSLGSTSSIATAINSKTIKQMKILMPTENIIQGFSKVIGSVFTKVKLNALGIQTLTKTRNTLLPKLMSGQIRVKNL
ncbi:MAG: hypothetical protein HOG49_32660, partial [Candidatus Scalindua sp.]|nr:hypothetical protein [Candidatus Scalindua sp.]